MSSGLHTIYCHKCGKAMTYPYEERGELYHSWCLPSNDSLAFADEEIIGGVHEDELELLSNLRRNNS
jgi:hypothetical protein